MKLFSGNKNYKSIYKKYLLISLGAAIFMIAVCTAFFFICGGVINRRILNELLRESERAAYDAEEHIEGNIKTLSAVSYFVEEDNLSYSLSRLKEVKNDIDCYMLGILSREGVLYSTENNEYDVQGIECFNDVLSGGVVQCEKFEYGGESYFLYGVPVYRGNVVAGGVCLTDTISDFTDTFFTSDYISLALISCEGAILAESGDLVESSYNIVNILSRENIQRYNEAAALSRPVLLKENINGSGARIQTMPLSVNDYVLISIITDAGYNSVILEYFYLIVFAFLIFMVILAAIIIFSLSYFKKANLNVLEKMRRFSEASKILKVSYMHHSYKRPGTVSYSSSALDNDFGYTITEFENLFKNRLEYIIYSEDRIRVFRDFEDFYNSTDSRRKISFRIVGRDKKIMWYSDEMTKDLKNEQIISLIMPINEIAELQKKNDFLSKRLDLLSRASSYYVFELNIKDRELFVSENLKERLGYVIQAQDCFKQSVRERLLSPHSRKELEAMIRSYKRGDRTISGNLTVMAADGSHVRFHIEAEVIGAIIKDETRILAILNEVHILK
ncbi:MAG: hypothetical protein LUD77_06230 [Clostridiales bacterium]|nr:hypothetical protein [Clostridiales bacterium]